MWRFSIIKYRWDFGKKSVKRFKNHQLGAFCFSHPWSINFMWLYLVYNYFFWVQVNFAFCTIGSSLSVDYGGTMHLERCYAKKTEFCTRLFVFFWLSWCVEAREFFLLVYKKGTLRYCTIQYYFLPKSGGDKK